jgi:hypothetical protein
MTTSADVTVSEIRVSLVERIRRHPWCNPYLADTKRRDQEIVLSNAERWRLLTEIGDFNRTHPLEAIRPEEVATPDDDVPPIPLSALPREPMGVRT